jgi:hypothetical protein
MRDPVNGFSCYNVEDYQRVYLCAGKFEKLSVLTDSICDIMNCESCPFWKLRAKVHAGKFEEAATLTKPAIKKMGGLSWKLPAFALYKVGKKDSAKLVTDMELKLADQLLSDTAYRFSLPYYSKAAIAAMWGDYDESIKWLRMYADKGFVWGSDWYIIKDPLFNGLKSDPQYFPEFNQIVHRTQTYKFAVREKIRDLQKTTN